MLRHTLRTFLLNKYFDKCYRVWNQQLSVWVEAARCEISALDLSMYHTISLGCKYVTDSFSSCLYESYEQMEAVYQEIRKTQNGRAELERQAALQVLSFALGHTVTGWAHLNNVLREWSTIDQRQHSNSYIRCLVIDEMTMLLSNEILNLQSLESRRAKEHLAARLSGDAFLPLFQHWQPRLSEYVRVLPTLTHEESQSYAEALAIYLCLSKALSIDGIYKKHSFLSRRNRHYLIGGILHKSVFFAPTYRIYSLIRAREPVSFFEECGRLWFQDPENQLLEAYNKTQALLERKPPYDEDDLCCACKPFLFFEHWLSSRSQREEIITANACHT